MKRTFLNQRRILGAICLLLLVASVLPARWAGFLSHGPRTAVEMLVTPVSHPTRSIALKFIEQPQEEIDTIDTLRQQRDEYHRLAYKLQLELDYQNRLNQQLAQISKMFDGFTKLTYVSASVVAGSSSFGQHVIRLNRGSNSGLSIGNVVTNGTNLVGRIVDVGPLGASVSLITSPQTSLQVRFAPDSPQVPRKVEALINISKDGRRFVGEIDNNQPVEVGDNAFLADNKWPREGFIVGRVISVEESPADPLRREVIIEPLVPLWSLAEVMIVVPQDQAAASSASSTSSTVIREQP